MVLGAKTWAKLGQIRSNVVKKTKKLTLQGVELQEKETKKIKTLQEICLEKTYN